MKVNDDKPEIMAIMNANTGNLLSVVKFAADSRSDLAPG
jgi:hypothetical protein